MLSSKQSMETQFKNIQINMSLMLEDLNNILNNELNITITGVKMHNCDTLYSNMDEFSGMLNILEKNWEIYKELVYNTIFYREENL